MSFVAEGSILLDCSPEIAFDRLRNHASWGAWMPKSFRPTGSLKNELNAGDRVSVYIGGAPFPTKVEIYVVDRPREVTWGGGAGSLLTARHRFLFEAEGQGTRVRSVETWAGRLADLIRPVLKPLAEKIGRAQLEGLRRGVGSA